MMAVGNIIQTKNLTKRFGGVTAVNQVNFSLSHGELRCLIGPNGAGKSTFFKCLTGQHEPSEGEVKVAGVSVGGAGSDQIANLGVGIKTQVPSVFEGLSVRENIWLSACKNSNRKQADTLTDKWISKFNLEDILFKNAGQLAHGQRQWVEMAMVTVNEPKLVLLDEPTAGMTRDEVALTAEFIKEINKVSAVIVVEHDMQFIKSIASNVTVFHQGKVILEDEVDVVLNDAQVREIYLGNTQIGNRDA